MMQYDLTASIITGIGTLQGAFLAMNLPFLRKGSRPANLMLMGLLIVFSLIIFQNFIVFSRMHEEIPHLIMLFYPLNGIIGPMFFFYVALMVNEKRAWKWLDIIHLLGLLALGFRHWDFIWMTVDAKLGAVDYFYFQQTNLDLSGLLYFLAVKSYTLAYAIGAVVLLQRKQAELKQLSSDTRLQYIDRFRVVAILFLIVIVLSMFIAVFHYSYQIVIRYFEIYLHVLHSVFMVIMVALTIHQPDRLFFSLRPKEIQASSTAVQNLQKEDILAFMEQEKPFLNPQLRLHDLAAQLDIAPHVLSEWLQREMKQPFYDFVNQYRVDAFVEKALDPASAKLTLLAIAFEVGFNSKTSFNRIVKKHSGLTPRQLIVQKKVPSSQNGSTNG
ncbi:MAG: helix-turn-helix domain-containing protein [Bacteroidota bacterium]